MRKQRAAAHERERGKIFQWILSLCIFAAFAVLLFVPLCGERFTWKKEEKDG